MQELTAYEYLLADIAANFGLDKEEWNTRIQWTKDNMEDLDSLIPEAEEQALYYAGVQALKEVHKGNPIGYPTSLDASASGTQILGVLSGCRNSMLFSNVLDSGTILDSYTELHKLMDIRSVTRNEAKKAIMTAFYNSVAEPKRTFPNKEELRQFYDTLSKYTPGSFNLNAIIQQLQDPEAEEYNWTMPDGFEVKIIVKQVVEEDFEFMGNFDQAKYKVKMPKDYDNSLSPNIVHSVDGMIVREIVARCSYDPVKVRKVTKLLFSDPIEMSHYTDSYNLEMVIKLWNLYCDTGFLSARILNFLDPETVNLVDRTLIHELISSLAPVPFEVITIHDCFRALPMYGNSLRWQYSNLLGLLHNSNVLNHILSQVVGKKVTVEKLERFPMDMFHQSNYSLN